MAHLAARANSQGRSLLQLAHVLHRALVEAILLDDLPIVQHVELLRGVLARKKQDRFRPAWMLGEEICHVIDILAHNAPAILVRAVLSYLLLGDRHGQCESAPSADTLACGLSHDASAK